MSVWMESGSLTKRSWSVLREHPYLLGFPAYSVAFSVAVLTFAVGLIATVNGGLAATESALGGDAPADDGAVGLSILILVVAVFLTVLVYEFLMGALVYCANEELHLRNRDFTAGIEAAAAHLGPLAGWAVIEAVVGWLVGMLTSNDNSAWWRGGSSLLDAAWKIITIFVRPLIVLSGLGPVAAVRASSRMLRTTWGKNLVGNFRIGLNLLVIIIPGMVLCGLGGYLLVASGLPVIGGTLLVAGMVAISAGAVVGAAVREIFAVALFNWATNGEAIGPFGSDELQGAIRVR